MTASADAAPSAYRVQKQVIPQHFAKVVSWHFPVLCEQLFRHTPLMSPTLWQR